MDQIQRDYTSKHGEVVRELKAGFKKYEDSTLSGSYSDAYQNGSQEQETCDPADSSSLLHTSVDIDTPHSTQSEGPLHRATRRNKPAKNKARPKVEKPQHLRSDSLSSSIQSATGRHHASSAAVPRNQSVPRSLVSEIGRDSWAITKFIFRLTGSSYSIWRWFLLIYVSWLGISYTITTSYLYAADTLSPICSLWLIGPRIPLCAYFSGPDPRHTQNVTKLATSQNELTNVMGHVGQNFDLAREMVEHEFAVRDLRIRVGASNLPKKREIGQELEILLSAIKKGTKGTSRMTAKVGKVVDMYRAFDDYAISSLEMIDKQQEQVKSLPERVLSAIGPFGAWELVSRDLVEEQVKSLFLSMTTKFSSKVKGLIDDTFVLNHDFDTIILTLARIKELTSDELGDIPRHSVLSALWESLVRPDELEEHRSHGNLLAAMTQFCENADATMKEITLALERLESELQEFRDGFATPALILTEYPLKVIISMLKSSMLDLEASKHQFGRVESGEKPSHMRFSRDKSRTKVVTATPA